jgi:hypothetical protein
MRQKKVDFINGQDSGNG